MELPPGGDLGVHALLASDPASSPAGSGRAAQRHEICCCRSRVSLTTYLPDNDPGPPDAAGRRSAPEAESRPVFLCAPRRRCRAMRPVANFMGGAGLCRPTDAAMQPIIREASKARPWRFRRPARARRAAWPPRWRWPRPCPSPERLSPNRRGSDARRDRPRNWRISRIWRKSVASANRNRAPRWPFRSNGFGHLDQGLWEGPGGLCLCH